MMPSRKADIGSEQLSLAFQNDREFLVRFFEKITGSSIRLVLTDNASSMLTVRKEGGTIVVRLQRIFLGADEATLKEIALFIKNGKGPMARFRAFLSDMGGSIKRKQPRSFPVRTCGKYFDLDAVFRKLNSEYFDGKIKSVITWGTGTPKRSVRKRTLGSYSSSGDVIRINPILDRSTVPAYYIEFIVYHEMLHADLGIKRKNGRREVHNREFKTREMLFREYERALQWEKARSS